MKNNKTRIINRKTYTFIKGKWINERSNSELDPHDPDYREVWDIPKLT